LHFSFFQDVDYKLLLLRPYGGTVKIEKKQQTICMKIINQLFNENNSQL